MAVLKGGTSLVTVDSGASTKAIRVEQRPVDVGTLGSYQGEWISGTMAAGLGAAAPIFSCRWGDATRTMLVRRIAIDARNLTTAFAAGVFLFDIIVARGFTVSDSGGTSILPTGNSQKRRTSMGTTLITDLRISSTATLTAGTRTLDGAAMFNIRGHIPATSVNYPIVSDGGIVIPGASTVAYSTKPQDMVSPNWGGEWPLTLVQNEGFIIRATVPGTGTWDFSVALEWTEVVSTAGFN